MTSTRIEAYISIDNISKLDAIRRKLEHKGYSKIINEIFNKYFMNIQNRAAMDRIHEKQILEYQDRIRNLEFELRQTEENKNEKKKKR